MMRDVMVGKPMEYQLKLDIVDIMLLHFHYANGIQNQQANHHEVQEDIDFLDYHMQHHQGII
jgi:hypothetical protein